MQDGNIHKELSGLGAAGGEKRSILKTGKGWGAHYQILRNPTGYLLEDSADELPRTTEQKDPREEETGSDYGSAVEPPVMDLEANLDGYLLTYADKRPQDADKRPQDPDCSAYFSKLSIPDDFDQILAVVVTVYSEKVHELHKTLSSVARRLRVCGSRGRRSMGRRGPEWRGCGRRGAYPPTDSRSAGGGRTPSGAGETSASAGRTGSSEVGAGCGRDGGAVGSRGRAGSLADH